MIFKHKESGMVEADEVARFFVFILGPFYLLYRKFWSDLFAYFFLGFLVIGLNPFPPQSSFLLTNLIFSFWINDSIRNRRLKTGWVEVEEVEWFKSHPLPKTNHSTNSESKKN